MVDVIDVIYADHRRIRRMQHALREVDRHRGTRASRRVLARVWDRLAFLIEVNADGAEEICHLPVYGRSPLGLERIYDAVADLDDIRAAVAEACSQPAGSAAWRRAAEAAVSANSQHLDYRERGPLADFARRAPRPLREQLGGQLRAFTAARIAELVPAGQHDGTACWYCEWPLTARHHHVLDGQRLGIFCSCDVCHGLSQLGIDPGVTHRVMLDNLRPRARRCGTRREPAARAPRSR